MQGSDQSYKPDPARYITFIYILWWPKIGDEVFRRCRENITCANSLVQEDFIRMQEIKSIMDDETLTDEEKEYDIKVA
jgi:hypothetical protein